MPERLPNFDYKVYSQFRKYNELKIFLSVYLQNEGAHVENWLEAIYFFLTLSFLWGNHAPGLEFSGGHGGHWPSMPCLLAAMPSKYTEIHGQ
jgi:hypothetical protein